jgi:SHS2 domain-containing protein
MKKFENLEHTADLAILAYGKDLPELFCNIAYGMFSNMAGIDTIKSEITHTIRLKAENLRDLLIDWLNELLYLHDINQEVYCQFKIINLSEKEIEAEVSGQKTSDIKIEIKAATYHDLKIEKKKKFWQAQVIFDI